MKNFINSNYDNLITLLLTLVGIGILIIVVSSITNKKKKQLEENINNGLNNKEINKIDKNLTKEDLTDEIFNLYKKVAIAKSKFAYDTLKVLLTDDLYLEEEQKLKQLKANKQKIIATNIKMQDLKILDIKKKENTKLIIAYLHVSQYDYIINSKKKIIRGTDEAEYQIEYRLIIEKTNDKSFKLSNIKTTGKWIKNN